MTFSPKFSRSCAIVAEKTGYPSDMLEPDLDLEADLGVDTVKQAETFAAVRDSFAILRVESLELRDFPTLRHVAQFVYDHRPDLRAAPQVAAKGPYGDAEPEAAGLAGTAVGVGDPGQPVPPSTPVTQLTPGGERQLSGKEGEAYHVVEYPKRKGPLEFLEEMFSGGETQAGIDLASALGKIPELRRILAHVRMLRAVAKDGVSAIHPELTGFTRPFGSR